MMHSETVNPLLIRKYNLPVPRYTSYPTVPFWNEHIDQATWSATFTEQFSAENHVNGISLYIHLPFCESLCTYCGCNKKITTNHRVEEEYLTAIEKEWTLYRKLMNQTAVIRELHLGGGTPTFFSARNLERLINFIYKFSIVHPTHDFSVEGHPNNTTAAHLHTLYKLGFRRISFGVQDHDPEVQRIINRVQPIENVQRVTEQAREVGFTSVNYDLIYGLPKQTLTSIKTTIEQVISMKPDRISFYSYAHVPWTSRAQRLFDETDLPSAEEKLQLYLTGKELLMAAGYHDIGMDHFALTGDDLYKASVEGRLHRNFMGYTTQQTKVLVGLGVSAISDVGNMYVQNEKKLSQYYKAVDQQQLAITRGYHLSAEDVAFKKYILDISTKGATCFRKEDEPLLKELVFPQLAFLAADGLIHYDAAGLQLTSQGRYFIRIVCSAFDLFLQRKHLQNRQFSQAI